MSAIKAANRSTVRETIYFMPSTEQPLMIVASMGRIPPSVGALLQEALDAAVILNALRAC